MKRILTTLLTGALILTTLVMGDTNVVKAAEVVLYEEHEAAGDIGTNDTMGTADTVHTFKQSETLQIYGNLPTAFYSGSRSSKDNDFYKVTFKNAGYFTLSTHDLADYTKRNWKIKIYYEDGSEAKSTINGYYTHKANAVFYIECGRGYAGDGAYYLEVKEVDTKEYEAEQNDNRDNATVLKKNTTVIGSTNTFRDKDYYTFKVPSGYAGKITVDRTLDSDLSKIGLGWDINIFSTDRGVVNNRWRAKPNVEILKDSNKDYILPAGEYCLYIEYAGGEVYCDYELTYSLVDIAKPKVEGVTNNKTYKNEVTVKFSDKQSGIKSATLDGKKFKSGTKVTKEGKHTLKVTDNAGNTKTVKFTVKKEVKKK